MILVDDKIYDRQEQYKKPTVQKAKSIVNSELNTDLEDRYVPDDTKMKQHQREPHRFSHVNNKLTEIPPVLAEALRTKETKIVVSPILKKHRAKRVVENSSKIKWLD